MVHQQDRSDQSPQGNPQDTILKTFGFLPSADWVSPFAAERADAHITLLDKFALTYPRPVGWQEVRGGFSDSKLILMPSACNATLVIGAGELPGGCSIGEGVARIAASPLPLIQQHGGKIGMAITIPTISSIAGVDASHFLSFTALAPGHLFGCSDREVPMYRHTTVLGIGNKWISFETNTWGPGCNPATEAKVLGGLHLTLKLVKLS